MEGALDTYWGRFRACALRRATELSEHLGTGEDLVTRHMQGAFAPSTDPGVALVPKKKTGTRPEEKREPQVLKGA